MEVVCESLTLVYPPRLNLKATGASSGLGCVEWKARGLCLQTSKGVLLTGASQAMALSLVFQEVQHPHSSANIGHKCPQISK